MLFEKVQWEELIFGISKYSTYYAAQFNARLEASETLYTFSSLWI